MLRLAAILFFTYLSCSAAAQDTAKKLSLRIGAEFWGTFVAHPFNPPINRPSYLDAGSFNSQDTLKDSPIKHGAYYAALKTTTSFTPGLHLMLNLYAEHRGLSYGMYNRNNMVLYPVFLLQIKDSVDFLGRKFIIEGKVGDLLDKRMDEGLFIYNIDAQGGEATISSGKWKALLSWYGDFFRGIGLNIDDADAFSLSRTVGRKNNTTVGATLYAFPPPIARLIDHLYYSIYFRHRYSKATVYAQVGLQSGSSKGSFYSRGLKPQSAFVAGGTILYGTKKWSGNNTIEVRYYGSSINLLHSDSRVRYRDPSADLYANTIGEYLYALRKYDNAFSQWAVFTEYALCDVLGASLRGTINYGVSKKTAATLEYDLNYIDAAENKDYSSAGATSKTMYVFYTAGYYYTPTSNCKIGIVMTNRGTNLNLGYPSLHQFTYPYLGFKIRCIM